MARPLSEAARKWFKEQGVKGGKKGSQARMLKITPEQRSELARKAALARWAKKAK